MKINWKRYAMLATLFAGCAGGALMTIDDYANVQEGMSASQIEKRYGQPVNIKPDGDRKIYEYVERIRSGPDVVQMRKYYFVIKDGKVVNKFYRIENEPAYSEIYNDDFFPNQGDNT